ncbi:unnamed protein product [Polarella glacialis]|uniref:Flavodoxin-like domain-containing protein n=1 Tax=Polarella glacialis TaxID=89957 RepID=A0A813LFC0_POLGL|nr:unnamed protein product [Polarella glacialis]
MDGHGAVRQRLVGLAATAAGLAALTSAKGMAFLRIVSRTHSTETSPCSTHLRGATPTDALQHAASPRGSDQLSTVLPLAVAAMMGVAARAGQRRGGSTSSRPPTARKYSASRTRIIGDWADGSVSNSNLTLATSELPGGITQYRVVHPEADQRYGEEYDRKVGSTDNVYLIKPEAAPWVLVGTFDKDGQGLFLKELSEESLARIGHLIVQFYDGKQASFVEEFIMRRPKGASSPPLLVNCSTPTVIALKKALSPQAIERCRLVPIKKKTELEIEEGRVLRFMLTPTLKLPEALVAFDPLTGTLFSGKFFSSHCAIPQGSGAAGTDGWEEYAIDWYHLFDCYFFTKTAQNAIRKIFMLAEALHGPDVQQLAPLHGPVVREQCWKLMAKYEAWTEAKLRKDARQEKSVLVMYASAYGHTKNLAAQISKGLATSGVRVVDMNLEFTTAKEVAVALESCDGFCMGSPTLGGEMPTQVKEALGVVLGIDPGNRKPCGVFGSFGWSGEAVDELQFRLKDSGFPVVFDPIRVKFRPTQTDVDKCQAAGTRMAQKLSSDLFARRKSKARNVAQVEGNTVSSGATEAFGKMRTSQCVMSSMDAEGKPVLSPVAWLNQASFDPPGLTISIPKLPSAVDQDADKKLESFLEEFLGQKRLDYEAATVMLKELLCSSGDHQVTEEEIARALEALDPDDYGMVTFEEARISAAPGGLLRNQLTKMLKADSAPAEASALLKDFTLNLVPTSGDVLSLAASTVNHKKATAQNGCLVLQESHAFLECCVVQSLDAGDHMLIYAEVVAGKLLNDQEKTEMSSVSEVLKMATNKVPVAMAAAGARGSWGRNQSAFAGASAASVQGRRLPRTALAARGGEETISGIKEWTGLTPGKEYRLQTMSGPVAADTSIIRSLDWDRDRFDIEFELERGTTYNSYVIKGADKTALVDTSHEKFEELYLAALQKDLDISQLDYLIVSHTEPDHSGLVLKLLTLAKEAGNEKLTIVGSKICIMYLEALVHTPFKSQVVGNNDKIDLGGGHMLEFVIAPNLHWPDTMFTFDHGTGLLFTCDAFGMHYCSENVVDTEGMQELLPHYSLYYDCLMKPNARSVLSALKKIATFEIKSVATGHGPMLTENFSKFIEKYRTWSDKATEKLGPSVAVFWVSSFGQSERLAQLFAHGLTSCSVNVEMHDLNAMDIHEVTECLAQNEVIAITAPGQNTKASASLQSIIAGAKPKKHQFIVLDSYGGSAQESIQLLRSRLLDQNIPEILPPMEVQGEGVTTQVMQGFEEAGMFLGRKMTMKTKAEAAKSQDKDLAKALGRLSSSLYVATAQKAGVRHAMVASWVTPASTSPLGVSLTIAKDRAMEPLLRIGDSFTLNILEEGRPSTLQLMKHFLQKFGPGDDRLEGVDCFEGSNGAAVLRGACAYLECRIVSRMDASDHWVGYAVVTGGSVAKPDAVAAVHHRKIGTYY